MKNKGLHLAVVIAALYAMFAGFTSSMILEETTLPGSRQILVSGQTVSTGGDGLPALAQKLADENSAVIVKQIRDLHDTKIRNLYIAAGNEELAPARWLSDGYPRFSQSIQTNIYPVDDLQGKDPRGRYFIFGPNGAEAKVIEEFERIGFSAEQLPASSSQGLGLLFQGTLSSPTLVTMLLIVVLSGTSAISQMKSYSVKLLHGASKKDVLLQDLKELFGRAIPQVAIIGCAATAWLYSYNQLNQFAPLAQSTAVIFVAALALAIAIHAIVATLLWNTSILHGLKGRLGFRVAVPLAYLIRVPGILLAVSLVASTFGALQTTQEAEAARAELNAAGDASTIVFEGRSSPEEMDRLAFESGAWLKREAKAGRAIVSAPYQLDDDSNASSIPVLLINNAYLERNVVLSGSGDRVQQIPESDIRVLGPGQKPALREAFLDFIGEFSIDYTSAEKVSFETITAGQEHFRYDPNSAGAGSSQPDADALLIVVGSDSGLISDDDFMALASQGHVLMDDPVSAAQRTPPEFMGSWIAAYVPVAQIAATIMLTRNLISTSRSEAPL
ncbi:hypothetical protein [Glutamicibacter arilaitensis]|uniref:hypothetical protein n=1 Tax=Glutamicibacter arilaitensis TaxID=256701 RepID=UPI003A959E47